MTDAKRTIVTLCGSTRFYPAFQRANYEETMAGRIVLSVGFYPRDGAEHGESLGCTREQKRDLDLLHFDKIAMSDEILVLNVDGYVGESTRNEIAYAMLHGKRVRWLEDVDPDWLRVFKVKDLDQRIAAHVAAGRGPLVRDESRAAPGWELVDEARGMYGRVSGLTDRQGTWADYDDEHGYAPALAVLGHDNVSITRADAQFVAALCRDVSITESEDGEFEASEANVARAQRIEACIGTPTEESR